MRNQWKARIGALAVAAFMTSAGCGPVSATRSLTNAKSVVDEATESSAPYAAVYEYTLAAEYLKKAQEEWGYSDWQHAQSYADLAETYAKKALERVDGGPGLVGRILEEAEKTEAPE